MFTPVVIVGRARRSPPVPPLISELPAAAPGHAACTACGRTPPGCTGTAHAWAHNRLQLMVAAVGVLLPAINACLT